MGLLVINIEGISGGGGVEVTLKWNIRDRVTGLYTGGVVSGQVYIINRAKGMGGGGETVIQT